jgi:hypothetical protein
MTAYGPVTDAPYSDRIIPRPYRVGPPGTEGDGTQGQGAADCIPDPASSSQASPGPDTLASVRSAHWGLEAFRQEMESFVVTVAGLSPDALARQDGIDSGQAAALASLAAGQVSNEPALLHGMVDNLSNSTAAALLEG